MFSRGEAHYGLYLYHRVLSYFYGHSPSSADSRRADVRFWRKYVHLVLVNRLERLSLPRNNVVRITDRRYMTVVLLLRVKLQHKQTNVLS